MKNIEKISEELFDKIRSRFENVTLGDSETKETDQPDQARFFNFDYISRTKKNYGNITLSLIDDNSLKIYFSKNLTDEIEKDESDREEWFNFLRGLRFFAKRNLLMFDTRDISRSNLTHRDLKSLTGSEKSYSTNELSNKVTESKLTGTSRISIQEMGPAKLIIKHSGVIDENIPGARSRKIDSIYIETNLGERFLMPFKKLSAARAMAEHIIHGGFVHDAAGRHITNMVEEMNNLSFFVRNTRHRMFEDTETQAMVESAIERYYTLRDDLRRMGTMKGYRHFAETFSPQTGVHEEFDIDELKERFVKKFIDDRMVNALPYVHRAYQQRSSTENKYIKEFDSWVDDITESDSLDIDTVGLTELMKVPLEVGLDGLDAINAVKEFIPDDEELFSDLEELSRIADSSADARPVINKWLVSQGYPSINIEEPKNQDIVKPETEPIPPTTPPASGTTPSPVDTVVKEMKRLAGI